jgi:hypothetical protein
MCIITFFYSHSLYNCSSYYCFLSLIWPFLLKSGKKLGLYLFANSYLSIFEPKIFSVTYKVTGNKISDIQCFIYLLHPLSIF